MVKKVKKPKKVTAVAKVTHAVPEVNLPAGAIDMQGLMEAAVRGLAPVEHMERLIALFNTQRERMARERFFEDLASFQAECPPIAKAAQAEDEGKFLYSYARYEDITPIVQPLLTRYGFSATVRSVLLEGKVRATCYLHHRDGHTEETPFEVPIGDGTRRMSAMQKVAAAHSFARRYAYIDALNLTMRGEDVEYTESDKPNPSRRATRTVEVQAEKVFDVGATSEPGCKGTYDEIVAILGSGKVNANVANRFRDSADRNLEAGNCDALRALLATLKRGKA